jgi:hypothetical protein
MTKLHALLGVPCALILCLGNAHAQVRPAAPAAAPAQQSYSSLIAAGYMPPSVQVKPGTGDKVKVTFSYTPDAPGIAKVFLAGTFNDWNESNIPMTRVGNAFQRVHDLPLGAHEYKFVTHNTAGVVVWKDDSLNKLNTDDFNGGRNSLLLLQAPGGGGPGTSAGGGNAYANRGEPIRWTIDVADAQRQAVQANKGVLVFFSSSSATASRFIEDNVFTDGRVRELVAKRFVPLRIDMQLQADLARRMGVPRGGVIAIYDVGGSRVMGVIDRPASPDILLSKVDQLIRTRVQTPVALPASPAKGAGAAPTRP